MRVSVTDISTIGEMLRKVRREQGIRQDDMAAIIGASHVFLRDVERGKPTVQLGKVLRLCDELGIRLVLDIPDTSMPTPDGRG